MPKTYLKIVRRTVPAVLTCLLFLSCHKYDAYGSVTVTRHPQGGVYVQSLTCALSLEADGTSVSMDGPAGGAIEFAVKWMTSRGVHKSETVRVNWTRGATNTENYTTTFSAPTGQFLDKTFWVEVTWQDQSGRHEVKSNTASCIVP